MIAIISSFQKYNGMIIFCSWWVVWIDDMLRYLWLLWCRVVVPPSSSLWALPFYTTIKYLLFRIKEFKPGTVHIDQYLPEMHQNADHSLPTGQSIFFNLNHAFREYIDRNLFSHVATPRSSLVAPPLPITCCWLPW